MTTQERPGTAGLDREIEKILVQRAGLAPAAFDGARDDTLEELGLDSLAAMELQAVLLDRYGVRIPDDSLEMSVPQITVYVTEHAGGV